MVSACDHVAFKGAPVASQDGENSSNLFDMQCMWYELEVANCHFRQVDYTPQLKPLRSMMCSLIRSYLWAQGDFGRALKNFSSVEKHFADIVEDQFDFHSYCKLSCSDATLGFKWCISPSSSM